MYWCSVAVCWVREVERAEGSHGCGGTPHTTGSWTGSGTGSGTARVDRLRFASRFPSRVGRARSQSIATRSGSAMDVQ
eukprot:5556250-Prymnesium_polylepis.1